MTKEETWEIIQEFYRRREARLRNRMNETDDLIEKYRLLRAIYQNRKKTLDNAIKSGTIKSQDISADGGPGSGRYPKGSGETAKIDVKAAKTYTNELRGVVSANGTVLKKVSGHAAYRMKERGIDSEQARKIIEEPTCTYPGNLKHKEATCYQKDGKRIVMSNHGVIITAVDLEEDDDA